jgi:secondary thiamine-phosphate synthase enzyme
VSLGWDAVDWHRPADYLVPAYLRLAAGAGNADPDVRADLEAFFHRLAPENAGYRHRDEGADDMPAHIKAALTQTQLVIPVDGGKPVLGTWQGIYLFEHRAAVHRRELVLHLIGE